MSTPRLFDRDLLDARRGRAARPAALPDFLLRRATEDIAERLTAVERGFARILNLGAHHGLLAERLAATHPAADLIVNMEATAPLLALCTPPKVRGDEELLPFRDGAFDLIASALALQFVNDLPGTLVQIRRALKPDGLFLGAVLGGATLQELRQAFAEAEIKLDGGVSPRVAPMADLRDFGALMQRAGFALPVADSDLVTVTYASPLALMLELRAMGAGNVLVERRKRPLRKATLARAVELYQSHFGTGQGRVRATFEIIHLAGWGPHDSQQKPLRPGSAQARLADALNVREHVVKSRP
ncbi:MAG: methyltransferase domain-containing protein, partial [Phycisphaerales bacterium]|nr:methyltransferase domain-containing protein [Hyphomonadaceae bacterium]